MNNSNTRKQRVFRVVGDVMEVPPETVNEHSSPDTIEAWDSLKQLNLILTLEEEFGVSFVDGQIAEMLNVELILAILDEILGPD